MECGRTTFEILNTTLNIFFSIENFISKTVVESTDLPNVLLVIGMALLTVLISIAIAIFSEKKEFETLDRNVILDHIVEAKSFLAYLALIFLPFLLWNALPSFGKSIALIFWGIGTYFVVCILIRSYRWMRRNKFDLRFDYLEKLTNLEDLEESWRSVWQTRNINPANERRFYEIFSTKIGELLRNDE